MIDDGNGGCELLSNYYLCKCINTEMKRLQEVTGVVNCFQIIIFVSA